MKHKVLTTIQNYDLIEPNSRVLVALSGGSDSMCLLNILSELQDELKISICAAHINHNLRGNDSLRDEKFVVDYCKEHNIELYLISVDINSVAKEKGVSIEEAGREVRYNFFDSINNVDVIATAHNLNDRIETFLFNFTRGTTLKGLCSIPIKRERIVRPLIDCTKYEIVNYCTENNIPFVIDNTNEGFEYSRNKIRNAVVTQLKTINPNFEQAALRCLYSINEDDDYLAQQAVVNYQSSEFDGKFNIDDLSNLHPAIRKRVLSLIVSLNTDIGIDSHLITQIDKLIKNYAETKAGSKYQLVDKLYLRTRAGFLEFVGGETSEIICTPLQFGENDCGKYKITIELCKNFNISQINNRNFYTYYCDYNKIRGNLSVRGRLPSDRINLSERKISKELRKLQNELNIPPEERDTLPIICDEKGIIMVHKCGLDARTITDKDTKTALKIMIE